MNWLIGCKIVQRWYNMQNHQTLKDSPYHLTFGQQPHVGILNLPIMMEIVDNLVMEAELIDDYSNVNMGMMTGLPQVLDQSFEGTLATVAESINNSITAIAMPTTATKIPTTAIAMSAAHNKTYTSSQDHCKAKRANTFALGTAVIGNGAMESGAQDSITTPKGLMPKGKTGDGDDFNAICWMELIIDCNQKPVELHELKSARIGSVFLIICCINNKDSTATEN
jgi:hypothetical protein